MRKKGIRSWLWRKLREITNYKIQIQRVNDKFSFKPQHTPTPSLRGIDRLAIGAGIPWQSVGYKRQSKSLADCHNTPLLRPAKQYFAMTKHLLIFVIKDSNII